MSTNLQTESITVLDDIFSNRKLQAIKQKLARKQRQYERRTRSAIRKWHRKQYFLSTAHHELLTAAGRSEDIVLGALLFAAILAYGYATVATHFFLDMLSIVYAMTANGGLSFILLAAICVGVLSVTSAWVAALIQNTLSLLFMQGMSQRRSVTLRQAMRFGLQDASRTTYVWTLNTLSAVWPVLAAGAVSLVFVTLAPLHTHMYLLAIPVAIMLAGAYRSLTTLLNVSLLPYVVLYEPAQDMTAARKRSRQLVQSRGRLFLLAGFGSLILAFAALYGVAMSIQKLLHTGSGLIIVLGIIAILLYSNGVLTVFYMKRRRARS